MGGIEGDRSYQYLPSSISIPIKVTGISVTENNFSARRISSAPLKYFVGIEVHKFCRGFITNEFWNLLDS